MESPSTSNLSASETTESKDFLYRLDLSYIGTNFYGWQSQPHGKTVQDHIERALAIVLREKVRILGASRTDTGVHAEHQVATFRCGQEFDCFRAQRSLAALLPPSLGIHSLRPVASDFHPIVHARSKLYRYRIWQGRGTNPFVTPYVWVIPQTLDILELKRASAHLLGRHNFKSFCAADASAQTFERTIFDLAWVEKGPLLEFYILGDGFLKQMVRSLVGTLLAIGIGKRPSADLLSLIAAQDRTKAGQTAPAAGLSLVNIFYENQLEIPALFLDTREVLGFALSPQGLL